MDNELALEKEKATFYLRFNPNHASDGKFASGGGSGGSGGSSGSGGSGSSADKQKEIDSLKQELANTKGLLAKTKLKNKIEALENGYDDVEEWKKVKAEKQQAKKDKAMKESEAKANATKEKEAERKEAERKEIEREMQTQPKQKVEQFKIIQKNNPMQDDYHVGIRKPSDIKTWKEAMDDEDSFTWGDFTKKDAQKALDKGEITIYSSYPIKQGTFVSPSKTQAEQYAGGKGKKVYSKTIPLDDVAWINGDEGQFAQITKDDEEKRNEMIMNKDFEMRSYSFEMNAEENDDQLGVITGRPIVYDSRSNLGLFDEVIEKGALDHADLRDVRFLVNHDTSKIPLARSRNNNKNSTMQLIPDDQGMAIRVNLDVKNNTEARNLYSAVKRGDITGMSFMFSVNKDDWVDLRSEHPTRHVRSIGSVVEVSAVTFPAYESTEIYARSEKALESAKLALENAKRSQMQTLESERRSELELEKAKFEALMKVR